MSVLTIQGLRVAVGDREVVRGLDLTMRSGEVHVIMGPNGSGKSTLAHALAGHPGYHITGGTAEIDGVSLLDLSPTDRVRRGLFLALQQPIEVPGVRLADVLRAAGVESEGLDARIRAEAERVGLRPDLLSRFMNVDLSGGERKRAEVVQFALLRPAFALFDEVDSGLDVDALGAVARRLAASTQEWGCGVLVITHFSRLLHDLTPTVIHVVRAGQVVTTGGPELAAVLERGGYEPFGVPTSDA